MGRSKTVPIRRFKAMDGAGKSYQIVGNEKLVENEGTRPGEPQWTSVDLSLRTIEGLGVRYIQTGVYELLTQPPVRVTSPDPQAP